MEGRCGAAAKPLVEIVVAAESSKLEDLANCVPANVSIRGLTLRTYESLVLALQSVADV